MPVLLLDVVAHAASCQVRSIAPIWHHHHPILVSSTLVLSYEMLSLGTALVDVSDVVTEPTHLHCRIGRGSILVVILVSS